MKIVYIIQEGCYYEGTGIRGVYSTLNRAKRHAEAVVLNSTRKYEPVEPKTYKYGIGKALVQWADSSDILYISQHKVNPRG